MDIFVLDIETKNTFAEIGPPRLARSSGEVGGRNDQQRELLAKMEISVVCVYSYNQGAYLNFDETEFANLKSLLSTPALLVGFSSNKFDLPILARTLDIDFSSYHRVDLSDLIEQQTGRLISLDALAQTNLNRGKTHQNIAAPLLYKNEKIDELKAYCQNDVELTKDLYDLVKKQGFLLIPSKTEEFPSKVELSVSEQALPPFT